MRAAGYLKVALVGLEIGRAAGRPMIAADPPGRAGRPARRCSGRPRLRWRQRRMPARSSGRCANRSPTALEPDPAAGRTDRPRPCPGRTASAGRNISRPTPWTRRRSRRSLPEMALTPPPPDLAPPLPAPPEPPPPDAAVDPLESPLADALPAVEPPPELADPEPRPVARPRELRVARAPEPEKPEPEKPEPAQPSRAAVRAQTMAPSGQGRRRAAKRYRRQRRGVARQVAGAPDGASRTPQALPRRRPPAP